MAETPGIAVTAPPRVVVAGLGGDSGKTLVSLAMLASARSSGLDVRAFKKGPDYIDAAWLGWAAGRPARNLDTFLMGVADVQRHFASHAAGADVAVIEGNRGLYDGADAEGTHSTAELAKALEAPVVLVVNATKVTRTVAACVLGCQAFDPGVRVAAVVLNRVAGPRHERIARDAIESRCGIPVVGVLPRFADASLLHSRHLGLVPPPEFPGLSDLNSRLLDEVGQCLDMPAVLAIARQAPGTRWTVGPRRSSGEGASLRIGYLQDSAFTFYYPENLEALETAGATLVPISSLTAPALPPGLHALYIGGGFPETHAAAIAANRTFLADLERHARAGLPIYAECGGLMLLARSLRQGDGVTPMAGVLPCDVELCAAPQGHGYAELAVDAPNPFFPEGLSLRGHEFHYSRIVPGQTPVATACAVRRGSGSSVGRDAVVVHNVWASYTHLHAVSTPEWAPALLGAARARAAQETRPGPA
jgi:cobyrinic acid a,c-diamide synthase